MFQMAANAVLPVGVGHLQLVVIAVLGAEAPGNLLVAIQTLKSRGASTELVTTRALGGAG